MATEYLTTDIDLKKVADGIRGRTGKTAAISYPDEYVSEISKLSDTSTDTVTPGKLISGTTAHDKSGAQVTGTYVPLDTSDATAVASDIASGKTAYVKGEKVTGKIITVDDTSGQTWLDSKVTFTNVGNEVQLSRKNTFRDTLFRKGSTITLSALSSEFGNATAADVAKGKTFTSAAGLKVVGTAEASSGVQWVNVERE